MENLSGFDLVLEQLRQDQNSRILWCLAHGLMLPRPGILGMCPSAQFSVHLFDPKMGHSAFPFLQFKEQITALVPSCHGLATVYSHTTLMWPASPQTGCRKPKPGMRG
jgi:hypothetical protein